MNNNFQNKKMCQSAHHRQISGGTGSYCGKQSVIKDSMNKATYFIGSAVLLGVDQAIKHAVRLMPEGEPFFRCPPFFELERVTNTGVAFSLFSSMQGIVVLLPAALMLLLCVYQAREKTLSAPARLAISGLIGGGMGNLVDRILFGGVTDYIRLSLIRFPIFNFADICITVSVAALMLLLLFDHFNDKTEERHG